MELELTFVFGQKMFPRDYEPHSRLTTPSLSVLCYHAPRVLSRGVHT